MYVFYNFMSNLSMVAPSPTLTLSDNREFVRNIRDLSPKYGGFLCIRRQNFSRQKGVFQHAEKG